MGARLACDCHGPASASAPKGGSRGGRGGAEAHGPQPRVKAWAWEAESRTLGPIVSLARNPSLQGGEGKRWTLCTTLPCLCYKFRRERERERERLEFSRQVPVTCDLRLTLKMPGSSKAEWPLETLRNRSRRCRFRA